MRKSHYLIATHYILSLSEWRLRKMYLANPHREAEAPYLRDLEVSKFEMTQPLVNARRTKSLRQDSSPVYPDLFYL